MTEQQNDLYYSKQLVSWYRKNKRDLPWRETNNPYVIWISEIILQQTRVAQGLDYFHRFITRFPNIRTLAEAQEDEILKMWEGLGYYSRALNLHTAAKQLCQTFGGSFPQLYTDVRSLKGIGDYTAAAICSFAWNQPYAVVDGNVYRVLSRLFALDIPIDTSRGKKAFSQLAHQLLDKQNPGIHNQAIMELGALVCTPSNPDCLHCPLQERCLAYARHQPEKYPVKQGKTLNRIRYFHYLHIRHKEDTYIEKRGKNDIWRGLYQFPLIESEHPADFAKIQSHDFFRKLTKSCPELQIRQVCENLKHVLSHQTIYATFWQIELAESSPMLESQFLRIPEEDLRLYSVPKLLRNYLSEYAKA